MQIVFVSEYWSPKEMGGAEISGRILTEGLARKGHTITVLTSIFPDLPAEEHIRGVRILRRLTTGTDPASVLSNVKRAQFKKSVETELRRLQKEEKIDLLHAFGSGAVTAVSHVTTSVKKTAHVSSVVPFCPKGTLLRSRKMFEAECDLQKCNLTACISCVKNTREIGKIRAPWYLRYNPIFSAYLFLRYKRATHPASFLSYAHYFPISHYLGIKLQEYGVQKKEITVVHNPLQKQHVVEKKKNSYIVKIYYTGNFTESKGLLTLLDACKKIKGSYELHLYGEGNLKTMLLETASRKELPLFVHDWVQQKQLEEIHKTHDIAVLPSRVVEGLGRILIEAMLAGNPVVGSRIGGIPDCIEEGKNGFLVTPGNSDELANALEKLIHDQHLREIMGKTGQKKAIREFSEESQVSLLEKKFQELTQ